MLLGAGGFALVLLLVAAVVVVVGRRGGGAVSVTLEALDAHPEGSFTASVVKLPDVQATAFASMMQGSSSKGAATEFTVGKVAGDTTGLYGVWAGKPVCDVPQLVRLVSEDSGRLKSWADALGVAPGRARATLETSTPVVLGRDTAVTETFTHGGGTVERQVVLQAGTAVLVSRTAVPIVRCASGDPLSPPEITGTNPHLTGARWIGFDPGSVADVTATPEPIGSIHAIDISNGNPVDTPLGGTESLDGYLVADNDGVSVVSTDGTRHTRVIDHPVANAIDDGAGGIIYQELRTSDESARPSTADAGPILRGDTTYTVPADDDEATIWRLPAGATEPEPLVKTDDHEQHWFAIDATGTIGGDRVLVYTDIHKGSDTVRNPVNQSVSLLDLDSGRSQVVVSIAHDSDTPSIAGVSVAHDSILIGYGSYGAEWYLARGHGPGTVGQPAKVLTDHAALGDYLGADGAVLDGDGRFVELVPHQGGGPDTPGKFVVKIRELPGGMTVDSFGVPLVGTSQDNPASANWPGVWDVAGEIAVGWFGPESEIGSPQFVGPGHPGSGSMVRIDLAKHTSTTTRLEGWVRPLRAPVVRPPSQRPGTPAEPTTAAPAQTTLPHTTTTAPATSVPSQSVTSPVQGPPAVSVDDCPALDRLLEAEGPPDAPLPYPDNGDTYCTGEWGIVIELFASNIRADIYHLQNGGAVAVAGDNITANSRFYDNPSLMELLDDGGVDRTVAGALCSAVRRKYPEDAKFGC